MGTLSYLVYLVGINPIVVRREIFLEIGLAQAPQGEIIVSTGTGAGSCRPL